MKTGHFNKSSSQEVAVHFASKNYKVQLNALHLS